ncbi:MAG: tol-pal system protein YbgF [Nitrospirae bacterium]|nr:tol-pal system protein YbgF [Nitrospirota bacterium]
MNSIKSKNIFFNPCSLLLALCSMLIFTGCATTEDVGKVSYGLNELKSEVLDIKESSQTQAQQQKLDALEKEVQALQAAQDLSAKNVSDLTVQIQSITSEFRVLTGRFEESRYQSEKVSAEMISEREKLSSKIRELQTVISELNKKLEEKETPPPAAKKEEEKKPEEVKPADESQKAAKPEDKKDAQKADVKDVYMAAYQEYKDGRTVAAREKFAALLKDYPEGEYSDNARFWIAESYYKDGNYEDAILAYEELLKKNPKTTKAPGALLKQGLAFYALKDDKTGKIILEKLIEKFPDSEQAQAAKKKLGKGASKKK